MKGEKNTMSVNVFQGRFVNKDGKVVNKEKTSKTISSQELGKQTRMEMEEKGYKYESGNYGTRAK